MIRIVGALMIVMAILLRRWWFRKTGFGLVPRNPRTCVIETRSAGIASRIARGAVPRF